MPLQSQHQNRKRTKALPPFPGRLLTLKNGLQLDLIEAGSGGPVLLVHGICGVLHHWQPLIEELAPTHRVIAYHRMGYGDSTRCDPETRYDIASNARDLCALMDELEIEKASLIGWSFGGAIVQQFALDHPNRVDRLVLVASIGPALPQVSYRVVDRILKAPFATPLLRLLLSNAFSQNTIRWGYAAAFSDRALAAANTNLIEASQIQLRDRETIRTLIQEWHAMEPDALEPHNLSQPALIVQGERDLLVPVDVARDLEKRIPDAESFIVPDAGHMVAYSHGKQVGERIRTFLAA